MWQKLDTFAYLTKITAATCSINKIIPVYIALAEDAAKEGKKTECIKLKVVGQDSNETHFLVKMFAIMGKLKKLYAEKVGVPVSSLKFLFRGHCINDNESPKALNMEQDDIIEVYQEQIVVAAEEGGKTE